MRGVLQGYDRRYDRLVDWVTETEGSFRDDLLADVTTFCTAMNRKLWHSEFGPLLATAIDAAPGLVALVDSNGTVRMANGGTDEGAPGLRPQYHANYYGAYFRDPDGNKLCALHVIGS